MTDIFHYLNKQPLPPSQSQRLSDCPNPSCALGHRCGQEAVLLPKLGSQWQPQRDRAVCPTLGSASAAGRPTSPHCLHVGAAADRPAPA